MIKFTIVVGVLILSLVAFSGLFLLYKGARNIQRALASTKWPHAAGKVVSSETTRSVTKGDRRTAASVSFSTKTIIHYQVNGRDYTTAVLHFGQTLGSDDKSEAALQKIRYPEGKDVTVSYNPGAPEIAALKPGLHPEAFWLPGAGLALLLPAALCLLLGPSMIRDTTAGNQAFENSVHQAIEDARHGIAPSMAAMPPPDPGGDRIMAVAAAAFGAVLCGLGILALTFGLQRIWRGNASLYWPTTPGVVITAARGGGENNDETVDDTTDTAWYARFVYQYTVGGTEHFNNLRRFAQVEGGGGPEETERILSRYRKGAKVKVSYFPTDPDVAVLEPGNTSAALWLPGIGVVLLLFCAAIFIWMVPAIGKP